MAYLLNRAKTWSVCTFETLEDRRLLSAAPWGAIPQLIGQDLAVEQHPQITGVGETIAVIDTGIDYWHPSIEGFRPKFVGGWDFADNDPDPMDTNGHGTSVAGIIMAEPFTFAGARYQGIAAGADVVALRVGRDGEAVPDQRMRQALQWVIDNRTQYNITVVNISYGHGGLFPSAQAPAAFAPELSQLTAAGVFVVAASGNGGVSASETIQYPASDGDVVAVGSVDEFDIISEFTERGPALDILAPGQKVPAPTAGGGFVRVTGTSFAAPFIAGAAALIRQVNPNFTPADIISILRASGLDNLDGDVEWGPVTNQSFPRLRLDKAISLAFDRTPANGAASSAGQVGRHGNSNEIVYDRHGVLHMAWYDSGDDNLKYASRSVSGIWSDVQIVDGDTSGQFLSLAVDHAGRPAIAYFHAWRGALKYAEFNGAEWDVRDVDWRQSVGLYPSLVFDQNNQPAISYYHKARQELKLARWNTAGHWDILTVDGENDVGRSTSIAMGSNGRLGIAYSSTTLGHLKFAWETASGGWATMTVDAETRGIDFISLKYDFADQPAISYYDAWPANIKFARLQQGGQWQNETVFTRGTAGLYSNLLFDAQGQPNIVFFQRRFNTLLVARGSSSGWAVSPLISGGGRFVNATMDPDLRLTYTWFDQGGGRLRVASV